MNFENQIVLEGRQAEAISVSTSAASDFIAEPGVYGVWATVDTHIRNDVDQTRAEAVTTSNGWKITANDAPTPVRITRPSRLAAIAGESGTLYYHRAL